MKLGFKVKALSDLVLYATSNNEGNRISLDYIPGSVFLGIVAKHYEIFSDKFRVFHSGDVIFSDANILIDDEVSYKIPFSFYYEKFNKSNIYNYHLLSGDEFREYGQLKQIRSGFMNKEYKKSDIEYSYRQKSAYDKEKRRSKNSAMYGYRAIKFGSEFYFEVEINENIKESDINNLKTFLTGIKQIGKSKSSEYGLVEIKEVKLKEKVNGKISSGENYIYANSRIALIDENGNPTFDLKYLFDGIENKNIVYDKSQIRYGSYIPFNSKRGRDSERIFIEKGSVIVLKDIKKIPEKVGVFKNEGFGDILINPQFLLSKKVEFNSVENREKNLGGCNTELGQILKKRREKKDKKIEILNRVDEFITHNKSLFSNISNSQWGNIRKIAVSSDNFIDEIEYYISRGVNKWKQNQIDTLLSLRDIDREFMIVLATQFAKVKNG